MKHINDFFKQGSKYKALRKPLEAANVCETARTLAKGHYNIVSFKGGLLTISVRSSAQAANIQSESEKIIASINEKLGRKMVEKVRYKMTN